MKLQASKLARVQRAHMAGYLAMAAVVTAAPIAAIAGLIEPLMAFVATGGVVVIAGGAAVLWGGPFIRVIPRVIVAGSMIWQGASQIAGGEVGAAAILWTVATVIGLAVVLKEEGGLFSEWVDFQALSEASGIPASHLLAASWRHSTRVRDLLEEAGHDTRAVAEKAAEIEAGWLAQDGKPVPDEDLPNRVLGQRVLAGDVSLENAAATLSQT